MELSLVKRNVTVYSLAKEKVTPGSIHARIVAAQRVALYAALRIYSYFLQFSSVAGGYNYFVCTAVFSGQAYQEDDTAGEHTKQ